MRLATIARINYLFLLKGFKAVEWGSSVPEQHSIEEIVHAKEKAGVTVVGLCTPAGILLHNCKFI